MVQSASKIVQSNFSGRNSQVKKVYFWGGMAERAGLATVENVNENENSHPVGNCPLAIVKVRVNERNL